MNLNLKDKVVVITGSSRGIGSELIKAFSYENSKIVINYFKSEYAAEELYKELIAKNPNCIKVKADVTNQDDIKLLRNKAISAFGKIDIIYLKKKLTKRGLVSCFDYYAEHREYLNLN